MVQTTDLTAQYWMTEYASKATPQAGSAAPQETPVFGAEMSASVRNSDLPGVTKEGMLSAPKPTFG